jgi:hypothetical protein
VAREERQAVGWTIDARFSGSLRERLSRIGDRTFRRSADRVPRHEQLVAIAER